MESWTLTEYEQVRSPQEISIDSELTIPSKSLQSQITCPICKETLSQTRAAPECLHRFCGKCVDKAIKKSCPICYKRLPSNLRSFKRDPKFDQLISIISSGENLQSNDSLPSTLPINHEQDQEYSTLLRDNHNSSSINRVPECEIILKPLDNLQQTRYIKCPRETTVDHLAKYLSMRPDTIFTSNCSNSDNKDNSSNNDQYKLYILVNRLEGHYEPLQGSLKIEEIQSTFNLLPDKPLEVYFFAPNK